MLRVIQWGTGFAGQRTARAVHAAADMELVGAYVTGPEKDGRDVGDICGFGPSGVIATMDREAIYATDADMAFYMTSQEAGIEEPLEEICRLLASGKDVVSTAATALFYPKAQGQAVVDRIEAACAAGNSSYHGCGIEPGWAGSTMPLILSGAMARIDSILIQEILDYGNYPTARMMFDLMGYGKEPKPVPPTPVPIEHIGAFATTLTMLTDAIGGTIEQVLYELEVDVAEEAYDVAVGRIEKGMVSGKRFSFTAIVGGKPRIKVEHVNRGGKPGPADWPQGRGWYVTIEGAPSMKLSIDLALDKGESTEEGTLAAAMHVLHSARIVADQPPGIRTFLNMPPVIGRGVFSDVGVAG